MTPRMRKCHEEKIRVLNECKTNDGAEGMTYWLVRYHVGSSYVGGLTKQVRGQ